MPSILKKSQAGLLVAAVLASSLICNGMTLALRKAFVDQLRDKVTIKTSLRVDEHHPRPNGVDEDGDIHMAGRDSVVLLPMVAEIMNGRNEQDAMQFLLSTSKGQQVDVTGVWRLWFEHPSSKPQVQGDPVAIPDDSNPPHQFEIHPITRFDNFDCLDSFLPIVDNQSHPTEEFRGHPATTSFPYYEKKKITVSRSNTAIVLTGTRATYNYTEFFIKLTQKPKDVGDGFMVSAKISDRNNFAAPLLVPDNKRMIFAKGSAPGNKVKTLTTGAKLHVLGIPRVNLNEVFEFVNQLPIGEAREIKLPYEMIIVAILK
jgi:hypothetical protein